MKLFIRFQFISISLFFYSLAIMILFFEGPLFEFLKITIGENFALNQVKADLGGLWFLVGTIPIMWFRTKDDFWVRMFFVMLGFVMFARVVSFILDGIHPITLFLFAGEINTNLPLQVYFKKLPTRNIFHINNINFLVTF